MATEITDEKIKELIAKPENRIKLHDLVHEEAEKLNAVIDKLEIPAGNGEGVITAARQWITQAEEVSDTLIKIFAYGCYFGTDDHAYLWKKTLEQLSIHRKGTDLQRKLELYPVMLILYAGGLSATATQKGSALKELLTSQTESQHSREKNLLTYEVNGWLIEPRTANAILELNNYTPLSDHVHDVISRLYPKSLLSEQELTQMFDRWDILLSMTVAHYTAHNWVPLGRFAWQRDSLNNAQKELDTRGVDWLPLLAGLFDRDIEKAKEALLATKEAASRH